VRNNTETETTIFSFCTPCRDDTYIMTSGNKRLMNKPENFLCEYLPNRSPKDVWDRHLERVERSEGEPRKIRTDDDLARIVLYCENEETEFNLDRGVFVRMSRTEIEMGEELREEYEHGGRAGVGAAAGSRRRRKDDDDEDEDEDEDDDYDDDDEDDDYRR
jgi:hypothetical protein